MPSPTVILGILLVVALAALAASGALLKSAWQDVAELEAKYAQQQAETQKAIKQISDLKMEHQRQMHAMDNQLKDRNREMAALRKQSNAIRSTSTTLQKALAENPVRAGRATTYLWARGLRDICRAGGGSASDCKIHLPKSPKAKPRNPPKGGSRPPAVLGTEKNSAR
tara:strand:+ start:370 stop:873 length:504 start_codon:yes stop_codon:yes gene_type:complete